MFLANSTLPEGVTRQDVVDWMAEHGVSESTWDLFRHRVVTQFHYKVGDSPGAVLIMDVESAEEGQQILSEL